MNFHKLLLIGVLFVFIDFKIEWFDLLPDAIGYIFIFNAFLKVTKPYATLGLVTTVILLGHSFVAFFSPSDWMILYNGEILQVEFAQQIIQLVLGLTSILNYICMFAVSHAIMPIEKKALPTIFISLLLLSELFLSFAYYLTLDELLVSLITIFIAYFITYIMFIVFLWRRSKLEDSQPKQIVNVSVDDVIDDLA